ncbi:MAG: L-serine ammonia-lyase [Pseudomonadota bacterium]
MLSILDLFRIGIGPSSSHTVGPMRVAGQFVADIGASGDLAAVHKVQCELQGSLALTGVGHGTVDAVIWGLSGFTPESADPDDLARAVERVKATKRLRLMARHEIDFDPLTDIDLAGHIVPELHPNGMKLRAFRGDGSLISERLYFSVGGGFIATEAQLATPAKDDLVSGKSDVAHPFGSGADLLTICDAHSIGICDVVMANEDSFRPRSETKKGLASILDAMNACIDRGLRSEGILPGGLSVSRRAPSLWQKLTLNPGANETERLFDWLNCYAMAVNEENAAGGRVVTAPTNGAAGIIPAVLRHYLDMGQEGADRAAQMRFIATAGAIGLLYKQRASISGAEMGCQGEVGVACSMAAAGLAAHWGGSPEHIACAAEIGIEHNLGLTCDPVGGLVQVPCIERNAIGAVKAANAARLALHRNGPSLVSLDQAIETMRQTGLDMSSKYKETSTGGLAVNVVEC